jgi:hypothetical protein
VLPLKVLTQRGTFGGSDPIDTERRRRGQGHGGILVSRSPA